MKLATSSASKLITTQPSDNLDILLLHIQLFLLPLRRPLQRGLKEAIQQ